jgi:acetyl-CoA synthetase
VRPQDRVCIFMDRMPDFYISFLGILKLGAIVQPLFSAFGPESLVVRLQDADTKVALTTMRHVRKLRKIRDELPGLETIVVVDCTDPAS